MSSSDLGNNSTNDGEDNKSEETLLPNRSPLRVPCVPRNSARANKFAVAVLCYVNLINYMDRFTIAGILPNIQSYYNIGNDMGGLIQTVFIISYMLFAPLFGYLGDRYSRRILMASGVFLWSITTLLGSFMDNFAGFMFFRALVGIGEASYSTIAPTIISDLFVKDMRSKMLALFYFAIPVGSGLGYIIGSETANAMGSWQWGLRVTPVLGVIAVFLIFFAVNEPERGEAEGSGHTLSTSYKEDLKSLAKNPSFMLSTIGFTCVAFVTGALAWWGPQFIYLGLQLQEGGNEITINDVSLKFGIVAMVSGLIGVPMGSMIAQRLRLKYPDCDPLICGFGLVTSSPIVYLAFITASNHATWCYFFIFFGELFLNLSWSLVADMLLYVVPPNRRSTAEAFQILISHMFGDASSPYLIGVMSEKLKLAFSATSTVAATVITNHTVASAHTTNIYHDFKSLQYSLFTTSFVEVLGGIFFLLTAAYIVRDKMKVEKLVEANSNPPLRHRDAETA